MLYFKHAELVKNYHVSLKTVHNWIDAAKQGKTKLQLFEKNKRTYIANTPENLVVLQGLAEQGKKYRNTLHHKVAHPTDNFYEIFNHRQIHDIITGLIVHHELPSQYSYFDKGAQYWDKYTERLLTDEEQNVLKATLELIQNSLSDFDRLLEDYDTINIIDIGCGNGIAVRGLLDHLIKKGRLNRYIAVDISPQMLHTAERNIREWFGEKVKFESHIKDITHERFDDLIADDMLAKGSKKVVNVALFVGSTIMNFRQPDAVLKVIYSSLSRDDILLYAEKLDSEVARRYFKFGLKQGVVTLSPLHQHCLDSLGIHSAYYDVEMGFSEQKRMRFIQIRLRAALTIKFSHKDIDREVSFNKGDTILLLRIRHQTSPDIISTFEDVGFGLLHSNLTKDRQYLLTLSGVDIRTEEV